MRAKNYPLQVVLEAITGSGGITLTVASRLHCDWATARKYIDKWETTRNAFEAEGQQILDIAESVLDRNIRIAYKQQRNPDTGEEQIVDTGDVKWLLSRKGKTRGYSERTEIAGTGDQGEITVKQVGLTPEEEKAAMDAFYHRVLEEARARSSEGD